MTSTPPRADIARLDQLTGGAFTAPTSGERAQRVRAWLATDPSFDDVQDVFRELSARDKGAARPLRERLDDARRQRTQDSLATEWAERAQALLAAPRMNLADGLAWQRDAAKAGAPLSREPLLTLKAQLADRTRSIEEAQHQAMVQREAAALLAQRLDVLSTRSWAEAQAAIDGLQRDVQAWEAVADALKADAAWASVDAKHPSQLDASRVQLLGLWQAFQGAVAQAAAAAADPSLPLPEVPLWAQEIRQSRAQAESSPEARVEGKAPKRPAMDPAEREAARAAVQEPLSRLESEIAEGHGKASAGAANALRQALKDHGRWVGDALNHRAQSALAAASELEGWQRWRADQLREELVQQAVALLQRPAGQALGGRKMQESLRDLRERWKQVDQGGVPNHGLWRRFDEACNEAHKVVEAWVERVRQEAAEHRAQREALIEELKAWTASQTQQPVAAVSGEAWRATFKSLSQFADRWRQAGHLNERQAKDLEAAWRKAFDEASGPLEQARAASEQRRQGLIEEARALAQTQPLRVDAVRALQQRWQAEAHTVPLDRRHEQKLWDAFRGPIDDAFARKDADRERQQAALGAVDRAVLAAAAEVQSAVAQGDARLIQAALLALEKAQTEQRHEQAKAAPEAPAQAAPADAAHGPVDGAMENAADGAVDGAAPGSADSAADNSVEGSANGAEPVAATMPATPAPAAPVSATPARRVVAVRGDDRPGARLAATGSAASAPRAGDRAAPGRASRDGRRPDGPGPARDARRPTDAARRGGEGREGRDFRDFRDSRDDRAMRPRLGDAAFRAQREAVDAAQLALRRLAAQAHGEVLTQVLQAWAQRDPQALPAAVALGRPSGVAARAAWSKALGQAPTAENPQALLRLEIAAEVPTPAAHLADRRMLQLQLLTRRHDATPQQTWVEDVAQVLGAAHAEEPARRLQTVLRALLK